MDYKKLFIDAITKEGFLVHAKTLDEYKVYFCFNEFKCSNEFIVKANSYVLILTHKRSNEYCAIYMFENEKIKGYNMMIEDINLNMYFISLRKKKIEKLKSWVSGMR